MNKEKEEMDKKTNRDKKTESFKGLAGKSSFAKTSLNDMRKAGIAAGNALKCDMGLCYDKHCRRIRMNKEIEEIVLGLRDESSAVGERLPFKIEVHNGHILIRPKGYGEKVSVDGKGSPIMVEYYEGEVRVIVWDDINKEDPKTISMEKARETNRKPEGISQK